MVRRLPLDKKRNGKGLPSLVRKVRAKPEPWPWPAFSRGQGWTERPAAEDRQLEKRCGR